MSRQQILVLGSDNIVGQRIVGALAASDWATPISGDIASLKKSPAVSAIVNAVTGSANTIRSTATKLFITAAQLIPTPRIVYVSSMTVYGSATGAVDEQSPLLGDVSNYAAAHVDAEALAHTYARSVILRPGCEYGPGCVQWSERVGRWLLARRIGDLGALGDGYCNLIYIDDVVSAVLQALRAPDIEGQSFNLVMASPPTWNEYLLLYAKALGAVPVRRVTQRRLKLETKIAAIPLKVIELVAQRLGITARFVPEAIPPSFLTLCSQEITLTVTKAETRLGLQWTPLAAGLKQAAAALLALT